jgi:hypothetical protein
MKHRFANERRGEGMPIRYGSGGGESVHAARIPRQSHPATGGSALQKGKAE